MEFYHRRRRASFRRLLGCAPRLALGSSPEPIREEKNKLTEGNGARSRPEQGRDSPRSAVAARRDLHSFCAWMKSELRPTDARGD